MPPLSPKGEKPGFYQFGLSPGWQRLAVPNGGTWILFSATFSGGGSGTLTRYAILRSESLGASPRLINLLPGVALTNNSDHAIWNDRKLSPFPLFITADFIWDFEAGESHFSQHRFLVKVWRFDPSKGRYVLALSYKTVKKYVGLDASDAVNVIAPERGEIVRRLRGATPLS